MMKLSSNIMRFYHELGLKKTIDILADAGFSGIDFNTDLQEYHTDVHDRAYYEEIREYARDKGIVFSQTHAPFSSSYVDEEATRQRFCDIVKGMQHSAFLGAEMVVIHPCKHLYYKNEGGEMMFEYNMDFYRSLIPYAEEFGIKIAIENINGSVTETAKGLVELFDALDNPAFVVCFDVGHGNVIGENPAEMIRAIGKRIKCTHIHDNDGTRDGHTLPFYGNVAWESVMEALAEVGYNGDLNYEASAFVGALPNELKAEGAAYMAKVGQYLINRFEHYKSLQ